MEEATMTTSKHTQDRLEVTDMTNEDGRVYLTVEGKELALASVFNLLMRGNTIGDARRLAACWNVCEGVDTLELETAARYKALATGYRKRTEQRDMLLKALSMARECVQADMDSLVETCRHPDGSMVAADATLVAAYAEKLGIIDMAIKNGGAE